MSTRHRPLAATAQALASFGLLLSCASGCSGIAEKYDRPLISEAMVERTGHPIGPAAEPGTAAIPDGIRPDDGVSEEEAVAIALWNNAAFQEAIAGLGLDRADLIQAGLLTNPSFYVLFPVGPKQLEFTLKLPLEALWLMPNRVAAARIDCEKAASLLVENGLALVRDVKVAFAALRQARRQVSIAHEAAALLEEIAKLQEARLRAGDASELEVSASRVKSLKARARADRLACDARVAEERLRALLGCGKLAESFRFDDEPGLASATAPVPAVDDLLAESFATRPDLRAAELAIEAAAERAGIARWEAFRIAAALDANGEGKKGFEAGPGLDLDVPIFDRGEGRQAKADAALERAARHYVTVRDAIALAVREAHARYADAAQALAGWRGRVVPALVETSERMEQSRAGGEASYLQALESREFVLDARSQEVDLEKEAFVAKAELERQVGYRIPRTGPEAMR